MTYSMLSAGGDLVLRIGGELDALSLPELRPALDSVQSDRTPSLVVDLTDLRLIDSTGVGAIVALYKRFRAAGRSLVVRNVSEQPLAIFRLLQLDRVLMA